MGPLCLSCLPLAWPHWLPPALLPLVPFQKPTMSGAVLKKQEGRYVENTYCKDATSQSYSADTNVHNHATQKDKLRRKEMPCCTAHQVMHAPVPATHITLVASRLQCDAKCVLCVLKCPAGGVSVKQSQTEL